MHHTTVKLWDLKVCNYTYYQYRLTPGFGGFTPVPHVTTAYRLTCRWRDIKNPPLPMEEIR
ncbi:TPA: hypothetical protein JWJ95_004444 [Escherichia coli]|nr:hypothetical protein [Escherichia coli]HAJ3362978.1 hypothetical protein [Escherichia coli]HAX2885953.1 hypothetical protein [Escherichia coli]